MATLDSAPAEVLHTICGYLSPKDAAALRSTSNKLLAEVAAHYLIRQVRFHTSQASIDRLRNIANHDVLRQYVDMIHFEANLLSNIPSREAFLERLEMHSHGTRSPHLLMPKEPRSPATPRAKRVYKRSLKKWNALIDQTFAQYCSLYEEQQVLSSQGPELMADIIPRFPRLTKVTLTIGRCPHVLSKRLLDEFDHSLGFCAPLSIDTAPTGDQLKHLIAPAGVPLNKLETLIVTDLTPSLFKSSKVLASGTFANLKKLDVSFRLPHDEERTSGPGLYKSLQAGALRDAIGSASNLEDLRVTFNDWTYDGPCVDLGKVLGGKGFDHLTKLSLGYVEASEKEFVDALMRQKMLKNLSVYYVSIKGSWINVINRIRKEVKLGTADFDGYLTDDDGMYDMEHAEISYFMDCHETLTIGTAMEMYATNPFDDGEDEQNPLEMYDEEYADYETLEEMYHEMLGEDMIDETDCNCSSCRALLSDIDDLSDESDDSDDSDTMPSLEDYDD